MRRAAAAAVLAALAVLAVLLPGCGIDIEDAPRGIGPERVPAELGAPPPAPPAADRPGAVAFTVYLLRGDRLAPVLRAAVGTVTVADRLDALVAGPTQEEAATGLRSTLPEGPRLEVTSVAGSVVTVDVSTGLTTIGGPEQVLAVAQIVFTATEAPGVTAVAFTADDRRAATPTADGSIADRPVSRADFPGLG
ncbi:MAG: GerMN domain-containing protein [Actinomycetes bacterium]